MLDSLLHLGRNSDFLDSIIKYPPVSSRKREHYIIRIVFDLDKKEVTADLRKYQQELAKEYVFVGNTFAAGREKVARLTTDDFKYLGKVGDNLVFNMRAKIAELKKNNLSNNNIDQLDDFLAEIEKTFIENGKLRLPGDIGNFTKNAVLYTICVRRAGKLIELAKLEGYRDFLRMVIGMVGNLRLGTCHVCGFQKQVLPDPAFPSGSLLKVWAKDKRGFTAGLSDSDAARTKTFAICSECREGLIKGEAYVRKSLKVGIENFNAYLIPRSTVILDSVRLDYLAEYVRGVFGAVVSYEKLLELEEYLKRLAETAREERWYELTVVFGEPESAHFRLFEMVQDVPVTNLDILREKMEERSNEAVRFLRGDKNQWYLGFSDIYHLIPLRTDKKGAVREWKHIIELFASILSFSPYPRDSLLKSAVLLARLYRFRSFDGYNIAKTEYWDMALCRAIIKYNYLLRMLRDMGIIHNDISESKEDFSPDESDDKLKKISEWFGKMGYGGFQQALFLLGYLVGEVGHAQYKKGDEKKSILDKIDFNGMKAEKVIALSNQILKSLRDYRILKFNEKIYHHMISLLNKYQEELRVNPIENTFYVLSGYALSTYLHIEGGGSDG